MRIGISSCQCNGKTTLVEAIKSNWPKYLSPSKTYRDVIKEKNLSINQESSEEAQRIIRDALVDQALHNNDVTHIVHDRTILDNLVYTLWLAEKGKITDEEFIATSINLTRETLKFYDVIFWLPLNQDIVLEDKEQRDTDETFRLEIDNIFYSVFDSWKESSGLIFSVEDAPPMIALEGDINKKLDTIRFYINDEGDFREEESQVFKDMESLYDEASLMAVVEAHQKEKKSKKK